MHPLDVLQRFGQLVDQFGVHRGLPLGKSAEGPDFDLVGQVVDDAAVGLQPPQDVRLHQAPQRGVAVLLAVAQFLGELLEFGLRAQQARTEKIEQRPEIGQAVLHGRAGQDDAGVGLEPLDGLRLPGGRVLDGLGLVQHRQLPADLHQPLLPQEHAIAGYDDVDVPQARGGVRRDAVEFFLGRFGRMQECGAERGREAGHLRLPVAQQRGRQHQERGFRVLAIRDLPGLFKANNNARTWMVLPSPMSSARQAPRPRPERNRSQLTPVAW